LEASEVIEELNYYITTLVSIFLQEVKNILTSSQEKGVHANLVIAHIDYVVSIVRDIVHFSEESLLSFLGLFVK
jgi:hypothetical protein